jgi:hypothetical protein
VARALTPGGNRRGAREPRSSAGAYSLLAQGIAAQIADSSAR